MTQDRKQAPFWRRDDPSKKFDISQLRPSSLPLGQRFETTDDVLRESERSEQLLRQSKSGHLFAQFLQDCRAGHFHCEKPYCPICARDYRRWLVGQLLHITKERHQSCTFCTILLRAGAHDKIDDLVIKPYDGLLRKRLARAGLNAIPAIGGYEMIYRARDKEWILHINLLLIGGGKKAISKFLKTFGESDIERPVLATELKDVAEQLSYLLKFTTYHRPFQQRGSVKSEAKPLNPKEHYTLVRWMSKFEFKDFLLLFNARRSGATINVQHRKLTA